MQGLPNVGDILDDTYRVESLLGQGGFGAVYLARQMSMDRQVAIKVLVAHAMNVEEMIERFRREVMAVRNLSHPNTIRIYDFRDRADGMLYYVMEYIKGSTLKDLIKEAPIPVRRVKHVLRQVLKSLSEAHSYGIIHRDLKPANIMLAELHGETDYVKVVDFGIAKIMSQENDDDADPLTSAGVLVGTLRYMAPEQITGQGIGPQSDLYAVGLIAIEMLTGKSVFEGTGRWEVLHKQISDDPVDIPSELISSEIGPFLCKALEKRLDKRFKSADEMLTALDNVPDGGAVTPNRSASAAADPATLMAPLPVKAAQSPTAAPQHPVEHTAQVHKSEILDDDATQMAPLPSEELRAPAQKAVRPVMQTHPVLAPVPSTEDDDEVPASSSKGLLIGVVVTVVVVVAVIAGVVMNSGGSDPEVVPPVDPMNTVAVAQTANQPVAQVAQEPTKIEEPTKVEEPAAEKWIRFATPGVKAQLFNGAELVGETPIRVKVTDADRWTLKAAGYQDQAVTPDAASPEELAVTLVKVAVEPTVAPTEKVAEKPTTTPTDTKPKEKPADGWVDLSPKNKPADKPVEKPKDKPADSDWVDVKKEEKPKVPLF